MADVVSGNDTDRLKQPNPTSFQRFEPQPPTPHEFFGLGLLLQLASPKSVGMDQCVDSRQNDRLPWFAMARRPQKQRLRTIA